MHAGELSRRQHFCRAAQQSCRERESRETALCEQGAQHVLATSDGAVGARVLRLVPPTQPVLAYERVVARQSTRGSGMVCVACALARATRVRDVNGMRASRCWHEGRPWRETLGPNDIAMHVYAEGGVSMPEIRSLAHW